MSARNMRVAWIEQCGATQDIKRRYGGKAAVDYLAIEQLLSFASGASEHPEFARECPRFVSEVTCMFTPEKIRTHIARIEHERRESDTTTVEDDNELLSERPATATERARQFTSIKELLIAPELGAS